MLYLGVEPREYNPDHPLQLTHGDGRWIEDGVPTEDKITNAICIPKNEKKNLMRL